MSDMEIFRRVFVSDKDGKIKYDSGLMPSNSFVIAFLEHLYGEFNTIDISIEDTSNTSRTVGEPGDAEVRRHNINAADDDATFGIVVGTGTTAESNTDYALATQIAQGTGSGQLDYGAHSFTVPTVVGSNVDLLVSRTFTNSSGASITIREIGIYCESRVSTAYYYFCILRDVLTTPAAVANGEILTVQYTIRTTV